MKQSEIVDKVAFTLPSLGSLIPAIMTFQNAQKNMGFESWQAFVIAVVAEGLGFTTITTTLDIYEQDLAEGRAWSPQFLISLGGTLVYLGVVLLINAILADGDLWKKLALALLILLAVVGGLMVALRNQLGKRREALALIHANTKAEMERQVALELQREQDEIAHQRKLQEAELQMKHDLKVLKLQKKVAEPAVKVAEKPVQVAEQVSAGPSEQPETFGKWKRWTEVPPEYKKQIAETVGQAKRMNPETYKRIATTWIMNHYGTQERSAYEWIRYAERDFASTVDYAENQPAEEVSDGNQN